MNKLFLRFAALIVIATFAYVMPSYVIASDNESPTKMAAYFFIEGGDSAVDRLPLKKTCADVKLNGFIASVQMTQVYRNEGNQPINATYIFPGSTHAAVNGMIMTIGERRIVAKIKEKEEAKQLFNDAKKVGKSASLLSQKRPNVFSMEVANIMPGDVVTVELAYTEILTAEEGVYEFVYPGVVGPRYSGDAAHTSSEVQWIQNPYLSEGTQDPVIYDISIAMTSPLPISSLESSSHSLNTIWNGKQTVQLTLKDKANAGNRDFILHYRLQGDKILTGLTTFADKGENFFLLVSEPPKLVVPEQIPARDYFFVVDVSGSMSGFPLDTTKELMANLLGSLKPTDRFNVLFFAGDSAVLSQQSLTATPKNIALAISMMNNQNGGGGTELYPALQQVFAMESDENASRNIVLITDGYISAEDRIFRLIDKQLHRNNMFVFGIGESVNRFLIEGIAKVGRAEAFVVTSRAEAAKKSKQFQYYITAPALTNISVQAEGVELYDMEPAKVPDMLAQRPIMVIGKYRNVTKNARITLDGVNGQGAQSWSFPLADAKASDSTLPQLWARKRLERLYVISDENEDEQRKHIVKLGLQYSLLTSHTSFIAVDETVRNVKAGAKDIKQPLPLPGGVSNNAIERPMPEPELLWLGMLVVLMSYIGRKWRGRHAIAS